MFHSCLIRGHSLWLFPTTTEPRTPVRGCLNRLKDHQVTKPRSRRSSWPFVSSCLRVGYSPTDCRPGLPARAAGDDSRRDQTAASRLDGSSSCRRAVVVLLPDESRRVEPQRAQRSQSRISATETIETPADSQPRRFFVATFGRTWSSMALTVPEQRPPSPDGGYGDNTPWPRHSPASATVGSVPKESERVDSRFLIAAQMRNGREHRRILALQLAAGLHADGSRVQSPAAQEPAYVPPSRFEITLFGTL